MRVEVRLPALGENIESADVGAVRVSVGDLVSVDQGLFEVEADKATVEVPAPAAGRLVELQVGSGQPVKTGQLVAVIETEAPGAAREPQTAAPAPSPPTQPRAAPPEVTAPPATPTGLGPSLEASERASGVARALDQPRPAPRFASPSVRRLARELGLDLASVDTPRVTEDDVKQAVRAGGATREAALPDLSKFGPIEREAMSRVRRATAEAMAHAWRTIPHVTLFHEADVTSLEASRRAHAPEFEADGTKLTVTAMLLKIVAAALRIHPKLNASLDLATHEIVWRRSVNLGVAVDTPKGLLVPVLRSADQKSIRELARELGELAGRARAGKLLPHEMQGATFSVTNLGGLGTGFFTPIINPPEAAILGVGRSAPRVTPDGRTRSFLPLSLSFDHRLVDGADGARFMSWVTRACEDPVVVLLEG
ncbi:MAG: 2-oxo acid dehydrogenase subunit E2 [Deltaproteobacteria bacterium]|nr:2-oxo acid dehydrogenase subunit E2 [Deltaproteobacteria bacterium]